MLTGPLPWGTHGIIGAGPEQTMTGVMTLSQ